MDSPHPIRLVAAIAGGAALIGMGALTACSSGEKTTPETSTTTTTSESATTTSAAPSESTAPSAEPTEKSLDPHNGNLFTPGNSAQPAPTVAPGQHHPPGVGGG